ncbi:ATP-dependent 6-phosphofructokinase [Zancudomyces culisetae]|uniref:6-phosphofructokinase n=1 Tax=Zancudomyces culisetae TaxID=1213189 RepID=A0A1R1PZB0_ZANCU|nr:ATP-dependent 6-phosphofructokinase [Zancudomyces culisetae]|eukprot:OMH86302.1 ATP-dependent 6-phosphofructokinase [Zancudomyces culisetae]
MNEVAVHKDKVYYFNCQISVKNSKLFDKTVEFYLNLGFSVLRDVRRKESVVPPSPGANLLRETWLGLYSSENNDSFLIKLLLADENTPKSPSENICLYLAENGFKKLTENLGIYGIDYTTHKQANTKMQKLNVKDPAGTNIYVYNEQTQTKDDKSTKNNKPIKSLNVGVDQVEHQDLTQYAGPFISHKLKVAVMTSGGDSQGMNAGVRSVVRVALSRGLEPYLIYEGYKGLLCGGEMIKKVEWDDVSGFLTSGGTFIKTARCQEFREIEGRRKAVLNLVRLGITSLIIIGGDGSLTGADMLRAEWKEHINTLKETGSITEAQAIYNKNLMIVGMVGSIDNDLASTDMTIGASSALARICESVDALQSTATSHSRAFVVEVMGRHCGWLALNAAICTGADYLFIPEDPPTTNEWQKKMCSSLENSRSVGKNTSLILVAEGAIDSNLNPIRCEDVKGVIEKHLGYDTRVTILGHVQRGGKPTFYDRYLATLQGAEAVEAVIQATPESPSLVIGILENKITTQPLQDAIKLTTQVADEIQRKNFSMALKLRATTFINQLKAYKETANYFPQGCKRLSGEKKLNIGIVHVGKPAGGINLATQGIVRMCINRGHTPLVVYNSFAGLIRGEIEVATWMMVDTWAVHGGSMLGMNSIPIGKDVGAISYQLQRHNIQSLIVIGGSEAYTGLNELYKKRDEYPALCIPMILIPASIANTVPGTDYCLGTDTAANVIVNACDDIKQSASAHRKRVFLIEVQGERCGFLATMGALAGGATYVYVPEDTIDLEKIKNDTKRLRDIYAAEKGDSKGRIVISDQNASNVYNLDVLNSLYTGESQEDFDVQTVKLGSLQQGGTPSSMDRVHAAILSVSALGFIEESSWNSTCGSENGVNKLPEYSQQRYRQMVYTTSSSSAAVIGIVGSEIVISSFEYLKNSSNLANQNRKDEWWYFAKNLVEVLSIEATVKEKPQSIKPYISRAVMLTGKELEDKYFTQRRLSKLV